MNNKFKENVSEVGFEPTPSYEDQNTHHCITVKLTLESGALDHSAILTCDNYKKFT